MKKVHIDQSGLGGKHNQRELHAGRKISSSSAAGINGAFSGAVLFRQYSICPCLFMKRLAVTLSSAGQCTRELVQMRNRP